VCTDWLWFDSLGFRSVYTKILVLKLWLFLVGTLVSGAVLLGNFYLANRFSRGPSTLAVNHGSMRLLWALTAAGVAITVISAAPIFGSVAQGRWETFLVLFNKVSFGVTDAEFGQEVSFFVVTLRMLQFIQGWVMSLLITCVVTSLRCRKTCSSTFATQRDYSPRRPTCTCATT